MERHVKERLVGAAVLVAAAVILIPEMLSGPDRSPERAASQLPGDTPLKTYTIDLSRSPAQQSQEAPDSPVPSTAAPPPEIIPEPETTAPREQSPQANPDSEVVPPQTVQPAEASPPQVATAQPPKVVAEPPRPQPTQAAPVQSDPGGGWAVQLGSFSSRATADGLEKKMRAQGYEAFVMPVKSGGATLYRVRIGPMKDRESASKALARIKTTVPAAAVVKHP